MKLLLTGGGTAGHVNPALAIAETFTANNKQTKLYFAGTNNAMERRLAQEAGLPYLPVEAAGFSRTLSLKNIRAFYLALVSPIKAKKLLLSLAPDLVVGTGGYVSWPMLKAAAKLGIPTAIHESNAYPGLTVRRLAGCVDLVLLNFEEAASYLGHAKKIQCVGNPLRGGFASYDRNTAREMLGIPKDVRLLVSFGGSLGASAINDAALSLLEGYLSENKELHYVHGTGSRYYQSFSDEIKKRGLVPPSRFTFSAYLSPMPLLMAAADLVICRAGAMTVSELARAHRASILVPSPNVADDHQTKNATALAATGAAALIKETELKGEDFINKVDELLKKDTERKKMETAVAAFDKPNANRDIYDALIKLQKNKGRLG